MIGDFNKDIEINKNSSGLEDQVDAIEKSDEDKKINEQI
jgi:hypothetical protein